MRTLSTCLALFLFSFCIAYDAQAFEGHGLQSTNSQQIDQLIINEQGVFLLLDGCWIESQGILATQDGIFVLENGNWISISEVKRNNSYVWRCPICGTMNIDNGQPCSNSKNHPK